ncbi:MAG: dihydropteroate synthase [Candidatus Omnitrophica bacterium CG11_big_fil_rev_8_21_14_0_20_45_26]|uniref:dihydropteroate synthase n=1 Tax=Candidatus Abzuiibacterium crystallinum TaxID=1974748 RepID=A0A2H0LKN4_9BACT|nr:MAG: dihydropteroate synthase [Candidatus Omnitrophica bacterium CG11_big_fil_rev_8_21_14_0_20_45_26]PIW63945.1 MAG: dihydropteroate synthase [Candidatus Omnitrophica bacterium CG12_big_fil_rev_8_21_14_0_65_45_16]
MSGKLVWKIKGQVLNCSKPLFMGILNITPDSFSDGGRFQTPESAREQALALEAQGADILDIGAESTRPGAPLLSFNQELERLEPVLDGILKAVRIPISIDTTKSQIADYALGMGAAIVNDVSGLKGDPEMGAVIAKHQAGVVLMHRRGDAQSMQQLTHYDSLIADILKELQLSIDLAMQAGIGCEAVTIDPGIGFSKTADQNFQIIKSLAQFRKFERPILIGASRKSFLAAAAQKESSARLNASTAVHTLALERGANILRVHDVAAAREAWMVTKEVLL